MREASASSCDFTPAHAGNRERSRRGAGRCELRGAKGMVLESANASRDWRWPVWPPPGRFYVLHGPLHGSGFGNQVGMLLQHLAIARRAERVTEAAAACCLPLENLRAVGDSLAPVACWKVRFRREEVARVRRGQPPQQAGELRCARAERRLRQRLRQPREPGDVGKHDRRVERLRFAGGRSGEAAAIPGLPAPEPPRRWRIHCCCAAPSRPCLDTPLAAALIPPIRTAHKETWA